ncbi:MAG: hypothetical protein J6C25_01725 [Treponema sp.]|nr:hypothetical protein [Treponema sp.]
MKRIIGMLSTFLIIGFVLCLVFGFLYPHPVELINSAVFPYKFLSGLQYFLAFLPALFFAGFIISLAVHFGHNAEGGFKRFSKATLERYKLVIITSLICAFVLTLSNECFSILIKNKKENLINRPKIITEYVKVGNNLLNQGYYNRALNYANAALKLEPNSKEASILKDKATVEINKMETSNLHFKLYENDIESNTVDRVLINSEQISEVYTLYQKAVECFNNEEWFNAHYYATLGINLATPKDPNLSNLKDIANEAWNNLTEFVKLQKSEDQNHFEKKYEGYLALHQKDDLKAYYIFKELSTTSRELSIDPDVNFYLDVAENRIREKYFFVDETFEQESFEYANNIYFAYDYKDGSKDIVYFKGVTTVEETGNSIQYLRDLTIVTIDKDKEVYRTVKVPYAKVLPVSVESLNETTKQLLEIDEKTKSIPYLMLNSIGRSDPSIKITPTFTYATEQNVPNPSFLILPIPFDDFILLEKNTINPDTLSLIDLVKFVNIAEKYGFAETIFVQVLMNRLLFPLWILIILIFAATFAWHNRIGDSQYFKFSWIFSFPFIILLCMAYYKIAMFVFMLNNYALIVCFKNSLGIVAAIVFYVSLLFIVSLYFVSRKGKE